MSTGPGGVPREGDLRAEVVASLDGHLSRRGEATRQTVLGAGSDDLESGRSYLQVLGKFGYSTPTWATEHGGMGLDEADAKTVREALGEFESPDLYPFMVGVDLIGPTLLAHAAPDQQTRWLGGIRTGREIWCQLFSEPDAGSDLANLKARAVRDGDGWILNGSKLWSSRAHYSQWGLLLARTDPTLPKHRGITAFGLSLSLPGVTVRPLVQMNGDSHFNEVFFDDVHIPGTDRIGAPGEGWRVALTCLSLERSALAGGLGISHKQMQALASSPGIADSAARRDRLTRQWATLSILEWSGQRASESRLAERIGPEGSLAKLGTNAMIKGLANLGMEAAGAAATVYEPEAPVRNWQTMWEVSPSLSIRGGTDEIQRNIIGERYLGLPPEPRVDKDRPFDERPDR